MLSDPGHYGNCVTTTLASLTQSSAANCQKEAEKSHYTEQQIQDNKDKLAREAAVKKTGRVSNPTPTCDPTDPSCGAKAPQTQPPTPPVADNPPPAPQPKPQPEPAPAAPAPAPAPGNAGFDDTSAAESEAAADIASCDSQQSNASRCCNNPLSCASSMNSADQASLANLFNSDSGSGGIADSCRAMGSLASNYGNVNSGLSAVCAGAHNSCSSICGSLADKYSNKLSNCDGCAARDIYSDTYQKLASRRSTCQSLSARANQLAVTGLSTANNNSLADYCQQQAGAPNPNSLNPNLSANNPSSGLPSNSGGSVNLPYGLPNAPTTANAMRGGESGFREGTRVPSARDFNVDGSTGFKGYDNKNPASQNPVSDAVSRWGGPSTSGNVPNNSGGPIPGAAAGGSFGGATGSAQLNRAGSASSAGATAGKQSTDIDQGLRGGGGYTQPGGSGLQPASQYANGGGGGNRRIAGNDNQFEAKIDLKQYLPGGSRAAARSWSGNEINKKEENLFLLISNKMMEKCRLGILWQCQ